MSYISEVPVIDLFAGPGGLGEGFSAFTSLHGDQPFSIGLSIEKDQFAHKTLLLRSFVRQFHHPPPEYYQLLTDMNSPLEKRLESLFAKYPNQAECAVSEAWKAELGKEEISRVKERITGALGNREPWVLLGGPPCQAYSIAGRSRNRGVTGYIPEDDGRQFLYVEYLQVIAEHRPSMFIMENVKGLLSATVSNQKIFERILSDLKDPVKALVREGREACTAINYGSSVKYTIYSLVEPARHDNGELQDFVVPMEKYGIPQKRQRLILLGVREDLCGKVRPSILTPRPMVTSRDVLDDLPALRSGFSRQKDSKEKWTDHLKDIVSQSWFKPEDDPVCYAIKNVLDSLVPPKNDRGAEFIRCNTSPWYKPDWYSDSDIGGVFNHVTRGHMGSDLYRYLYVSCFGLMHRKSPVLADFPEALLPKHKNVKSALKGGFFDDRFRVQVADKPATTITSHLSRDGHSYIHYDPAQCRSLTAREVARLQTFPDNYFFYGSRSAQYTQIGNAVPPLLAREIAGIIFEFLKNTGALD